MKNSDYRNEKGSEFVGIRNYTNKHGEVSNQRLNVGVDILEAKKKDLEALKGLSIDDLYVIADSLKIGHSIADKALAELLVSGTKNVSKEIENRTAASQAQTKSYTWLNKGTKRLDETGETYVSGFFMSKEIITEGVYPTTKKQDKTKVKDAIKKQLKFRMNNFRSFYFANAEKYKVNGNDIEVI